MTSLHPGTTKRCPKCSVEKPLDLFTKNQSWCKRCKADLARSVHDRKKDDPAYRQAAVKRAKEWRLANAERVRQWQRRRRAADPERYREHQRRWVARHAEQVRETKRLEAHWRRTKKREGDLTLDEWRDLCAAYGERCAYCNCKPEKLSMDHVIPLSRGGQHTKDNVVPACLPCNLAKNAGPAPEFQLALG